MDHNLNDKILEKINTIKFLLPNNTEDAASAYDALQACYALGDWNSCRELIKFIRDNVDSKPVLLDIAVKEAQLDVIERNLSKGLKKLKKLKKEISSQGPGFYESRKATLYHINGDHESFINSLRSAFDVSNNNPIILIDLAFAESFFGNYERAKHLLDSIDKDKLPPFGEIFINISYGIIALSDDGQLAQQMFGKTMLDLFQYSSNPAIWTALAMCAGWYALACKKCGNIKDAEKIICHVWSVLSADPEKTLFNKITSEIPSVIDIIKNKPYITKERHLKNLEFQIKSNVVTLKTLKNFGLDDAIKLKIEYFFYTRSIEKAELLRKELINKGYTVTQEKSAANKQDICINGWTIPMQMNEKNVDDWTKEMCELGFKYDCIFDGWGTTPNQ